MSSWRVRQLLLALILCTLGISVLIHLEYFPPLILSSDALGEIESALPASEKDSEPKGSVDFDYLAQGKSAEPTSKFRDSLSINSSYITTWTCAGFTNQFMGYVNMIYLGKLSDRIPIIPPFTPNSHIAIEAGIVPFGDIFDLRHLKNTLKIQVFDWKDVKRVQPRDISNPYHPEEIEELGCWTTAKASSSDAMRAEHLVAHLGLDVSYTKIPTEARLPSTTPDEEEHVMFPQLSALIYPHDPIVKADSLKTTVPSLRGHWRKPDAQLACFDSLYYATSGVRAFEWQRSWSPAWHEVGRHLPFTRPMQALARSYMERAFELSDAIEDIPPFIALHIRRGDFGGHCSESSVGNQCFPPLSVYARHVEDIKKELAEKSNTTVTHVIVMSDDKAPQFWGDVTASGWFFVNHTREATVERYGEWYPPLIDTIIQSLAVGFVGTKGSTFSLVGERRVHDWNNGVTREVSIRDRL